MKHRLYHYPAHTMSYNGRRFKRNATCPRKPYKGRRLMVKRPCDECGIPMAASQFGTTYDVWSGMTGTTYECRRCGEYMSTI